MARTALDLFKTIAIALVSIGLVIGLGVVFLSEFQNKVSDNATAAQAISDVTTEITNLIGWIGLVVLGMVAVVLIGYFTGIFGGGGRR